MSVDEFLFDLRLFVLALRSRVNRLQHALSTRGKESDTRTVASFTTHEPRKFFAFTAILHAFAKHEEISSIYLTVGNDTRLPLRFIVLRILGLRVLRGDEKYGPYLRLVEVSKREPHSVIVTLDDDSLYSREAIASLLVSHNRKPSAIVGMRGSRIPSGFESTFKYESLSSITDHEEQEGNDIFLTCSGGNLYPPSARSGSLVAWDEALRVSPRNDDIWYFFAAKKEKIPMMLAFGKQRNPKNIKGSQDHALWRSNVVLGHNDTFLSQCREYFSEPSVQPE